MVGIFKSENEKHNKAMAESMTSLLPKEFIKDQEKKLTELFNKKDSLVEEYKGDKDYYDAKQLIYSIYEKLKKDYRETRTMATRLNSMQPIGIKAVDNDLNKTNSEIMEGIEKQLNIIIDNYNKVFNALSDKKVMKESLDKIKGSK